MTCRTDHVIYMIECSCKLQYIGKTIRPIRTRIIEHLSGIKRKLTNHSIPNHFTEFHGGEPTCLKYKAIEHVLPHWRGGDRGLELLKRETFWIHRLKTLAPRGLNAEIDLTPFLK
ncbi:hypothetical protein FKM82_020972 [Ascaphus truei]